MCWNFQEHPTFENLLEGLIELIESYCIQRYSLLKGKEIKIRERDTQGSKCEASIDFPKEPVCFTLPALVCDNMRGVLPVGETYPSFSV